MGQIMQKQVFLKFDRMDPKIDPNHPSRQIGHLPCENPYEDPECIITMHFTLTYLTKGVADSKHFMHSHKLS